MSEKVDKASIYKILIQQTRRIGRPTARDKINALFQMKDDVSLHDLQFIFPLIYENDGELALLAAKLVSDRIGQLRGKQWNNIYEQLKYLPVSEHGLEIIDEFSEDVCVHLLGIASLNHNGYVREKALELLSWRDNTMSLPYVLLRLNDWVKPIREQAQLALQRCLNKRYIDSIVENEYLVDNLQFAGRTNLEHSRQQIYDFLRQNREELKKYLRHPLIKTRLFCYRLLFDADTISEEEIMRAINNKSYEVRLWLIELIDKMSAVKRTEIIGHLLKDKSAKVKLMILRKYEEVVWQTFRDELINLVLDASMAVREEARFILKNHAIITDFARFYRQQIEVFPVPGAILGLCETGSRRDYNSVRDFYNLEDSRIQLAAMVGMWKLSKDDSVDYAIMSIHSNNPRLRKVVKNLLKKAKLPAVLPDLRALLETNNSEDQIFALDVISSYGGWPALETILYVLANKENDVHERAKFYLERWTKKTTRLYSKPDQETKKQILDLYGRISGRGYISAKAAKELKFVIETRT